MLVYSKFELIADTKPRNYVLVENTKTNEKQAHTVIMFTCDRSLSANEDACISFTHRERKTTYIGP